MKKILIAFTVSLFALGSCSKDDSGNGGGGTGTDAAVLSSPENNSECTTGAEVSATQSKVTFQWAAAPGAQAYFVYVKNLNTQSTLQFSAGANTSLDITLTKGTPYSWYVNTNKTGGTTVASAVWKFYNAGDGVSNYAPFPADAVSPLMSSTIYGPTITLQWDGSDLDNDIVDYKVYMDTNANPTTLAGTVTTETLANVAVTSGGTYYWKVVTTDGAGNTTASPVYQFKVF